MDTIIIAIDELRLDPTNARRHSDTNIRAIANSLTRFGQRKPIVIQGQTVLAGNGTLEAAKSLGWKEIAIVRVPDEWDEQTAKAYALADNRSAELAEWDETVLAEQLLELQDDGWDMSILGFEQVSREDVKEQIQRTMAEQFLIPPFSVFDTRAGYWQARKKTWLELGIESEQGRDDDLTLQTSGTTRVANAIREMGTTSIFDPVLCEVAYRWFAREGATVLDPFAGGSVRGIVAAYLGLHYIGIDLRDKQVESNRQQADSLLQEHTPGSVLWMQGDSDVVLDEIADSADLISPALPMLTSRLTAMIRLTYRICPTMSFYAATSPSSLKR